MTDDIIYMNTFRNHKNLFAYPLLDRGSSLNMMIISFYCHEPDIRIRSPDNNVINQTLMFVHAKPQERGEGQKKAEIYLRRWKVRNEMLPRLKDNKKGTLDILLGSKGKRKGTVR